MKKRWMTYDAIGFFFAFFVLRMILGWQDAALSLITLTLTVYGIWQGLKWIFCRNATKYSEWNLITAYDRWRAEE